MGQNNDKIQYQVQNKDSLLKHQPKVDSLAKLEHSIEQHAEIFDLNDNYLILSWFKTISIWDCKKKKRKQRDKYKQVIDCFCLSDDKIFLVIIKQNQKQLLIKDNKRRKIVRTIKLLKNDIFTTKLSITKDNRILFINFYELVILNFTNFSNNHIISGKFGEVSWSTFDYCPVNNIVIIPIKQNIQVWNVVDCQMIIQKDKQVSLSGSVIIQIQKSGEQLFLISQQSQLLKIYDIDMQNNQIILVKTVTLKYQYLNISWIQDDMYILVEDVESFIVLQVDMKQPIIGKFQKYQIDDVGCVLQLYSRANNLRLLSLNQIVTQRFSSIDIYSIKM